MNLLLSIIILIVTLVLGVPVPYAFGASLVWCVFTMGYNFHTLIPFGFNKITSVVLLCVPMFILAGGYMEKGKIGDALVGFINHFVGKIRGSLAVVTVIASAVFGSISGSGAATLTCIGSIMAPKMKAAKYPVGKVSAIIASAAPLGLLIPPSGTQILFAWTGNQSVLACFLAIAVPGIILTIMQSIISYFLLRNENIELVGTDDETANLSWGRALGKKTVFAIPALVMPFIILGGIYGGIMTPTEAASVAVIYAIPVAMFVYRGINLKEVFDVAKTTAVTSGVVMIMTITLNMLCKIFIMEDLPSAIMNLLLSVSSNKNVILLMINIFMIIVGMLMDDVSGTLLCTPILLPIMTKLGVSPIQFAAILGVNLGMGNITPPTAPFLFMSNRITGGEFKDILKPTMILIFCAWLPVLLLVTYVPELSLWLPKLILGSRFVG